MDFKKEILKEHSFENSERIAWYVQDHSERFPEIMQMFLGDDYRITQRVAWVIIIISEWKPKLLKPFIPEMILNLQKPGITDAVKRNTVRILAEFPIPRDLEGIITEICFNYLNNSSEAIAVKVFSMTILERMVEKYPELKEELIASIEANLEFGSAGIKNRGGKILARLKAKTKVVVIRPRMLP